MAHRSGTTLPRSSLNSFSRSLRAVASAPLSERSSPASRSATRRRLVMLLDDESRSFIQFIERDDLRRRGVAPEQLERSVLVFVDPAFADELPEAADDYERLRHVVEGFLAGRVSKVVPSRELAQVLRRLGHRPLHLGHRACQVP